MASRWRSAPIRRDAGLHDAHAMLLARRGRPRSTCAGRSTGCARRCAPLAASARAEAAWREADAIADRRRRDQSRDRRARARRCMRELAAKRSGPFSVLTHCNAGWLATVDWGTATRADLQRAAGGHPGARLGERDAAAQPGRMLTAWELQQHGVPHTVIADNAGGQLMQQRRGRPGARRRRSGRRQRRRLQQDRHLPEGARGARQRRAVLRGGAVATIDWTLADGDAIPIEERSGDEVDRVGAADDAPSRSCGHARRQPGIRRHAGELGHRHHHRARHLRATADGLAALFAPETRR